MTHEILVMSTNLILAMASVEGGTPFEFTRDDVAEIGYVLLIHEAE